MHDKQLLKKIIGELEKKGEGRTWKKELPKILNLGQNAVYKRLNGTTAFTLEDLVKLSRHYHFSLAALLGEKKLQEDEVLFSIPYQKGIHSFEDYIKPIHNDISQVVHIPNLRIYYAVNEIPIFWFFYFEPLLLFKYFMWGRITWRIPTMQGRKISFSQINFSHFEKKLYEEVKTHYEQIESIEYWSDYILDTTMHQIKFCVDAQLFESREDLEKIIDSLFQMLNFLYDTLNSGKKNKKAKVEVYYNDITQANTCILVDSPKANAVYTIFNGTNMMKSSSGRIIEETKDWFENLKHHSNLLSKSSEKNRLSYLNILENKLIEFRKTILQK